MSVRVCVMQEGAKDRDHVHMEGSTPWLELLLGISGAFRPKVLTCLMGVTGAGKTTLMDVLAGRKTGKTGRAVWGLVFRVFDLLQHHPLGCAGRQEGRYGLSRFLCLGF